MRKIAFVSIALLASSLVWAQQSKNPRESTKMKFIPVRAERTPVSSVKTLTPVMIAPVDRNGKLMGNWAPLTRKTRTKNAVTTWQAAFDCTNTNPSTMAAASDYYGATSAGTGFFWTFGTYNSPMIVNDMKLNPGGADGPDTHGKIAQRFRMFEKLTGPNFSPVLVFRCTDNVDTTEMGPVFSSSRGGYAVAYNPVPAGFYNFDLDFSTFSASPTTPKGIELPADDNGGIYVYFAALDANNNVVQIPTGNTAAPGGLNMCSPADDLFSGTNPSSSVDGQWNDDNNAANAQVPDYIFQDKTNTATAATPFSEYYSWNFGPGYGVLESTLGLFLDKNQRVIKGQLGLTGRSATPISRPTRVTYSIYSGTTLIDQGYAALDANLRYTILDPTPGTGGNYTIIARAAQWLGTKFTVDTTASVVTNLNMSLPFTGDVNYDGVVNLSDFSGLSASYGTTSTSANWNTAVTGTITPADCDLTEDGVVNLSDFSLLSTAYGKTDATP